MAVRNLFMTATGATGIKQIKVSESYTQASAFAEIVCTDFSLDIGGSVTVDMGYDDEHSVMITGTVKNITKARPDRDFVVRINDKMVQAVDFFMASDNPQTPFSRQNIQAQDLVRDLLAQALLTNVNLDSPGFTFGVTGPVNFNLQSVWDFVKLIADVVGFHIYAEASGTIRFRSRPAYPVGGDVTEHTFTTGPAGNLKIVSYEKSTDNLRNRVVVYGKNPITATRSAASPFLPSGFFQAAVIAHEMIDTQAAADGTADINLTHLNRLTENLRVTVLGIPTIRVRDIVDVSESFTGLAGGTLWICFAANHTINSNGYTLELTLAR